MQGGWKGGKGDLGAGGVVGNMEQDMGRCKNVCEAGGGWGNMKGCRGVIREGMQRDFCGEWRGGRGMLEPALPMD